jgi:SAM-dependent methyltransferase
LAKGWRVAGMDVSEAGVAKVNTRFAGRSGWLGARSGALGALPYANAEFAAITLVETLEHLVLGEIPAILAEMRRVLMTGGAVLITTPNEEDLEAAKVRCPDCGSRFHRIQHLQAFSTATLRVLMEQAGFQTLRCEGTLLDRDPPSLVERLYRLRHRLRGTGKLPHLVYVGRRKAGA